MPSRPCRPIKELLNLLSEHYWLSGLLVFFSIIVFTMKPGLAGSELIYLIGSKRLVYPELYQQDLVWGSQAPSTLLFDYLFAPFWYFLDEYGAAYLGRFIGWICISFSLLVLGKTLNLRWWAIPAATVVWLLCDQSLATSTPVITIFQPKAFSHCLVLLALSAFLTDRKLVAGVFVGIATLFHPVIGGWAFLSMTATLLVLLRRSSIRATVVFVACALCFIAPIAVLTAFTFTSGATPDEISLFEKIYVSFRVPHHTDPFVNFTPLKALAVTMVMLASIVTIAASGLGKRGLTLISFVVFLNLIMFVGYLARSIEWYGYLKLYPFRLGAVLPLLFLLLTLPRFFSSLEIRRTSHKFGLLLIILTLVTVSKSSQVFDKGLRRVSSSYYAWQRAFRDQTEWQDNLMYEWIRRETSTDSIFITEMPHDFWLRAERAQFACFKHAPQSVKRGLDWYSRLEMLNGGKSIGKISFKAEKKIRRKVAYLSRDDLFKLAQEFNVNYYLISIPRIDLNDILVHQADGSYLYKLA